MNTLQNTAEVLLMYYHRALGREGARGFFGAANSSRGFYSLYPEIYDPARLRRIYVIKGGPGTGKSTFIDMIADRAHKKGYSADLFLCSSDTSSLDGIVIRDTGIAVLDGTPPHACEPSLPGACGEIIDLGQFWDKSSLRQRRAEIEVLNARISESYGRAYRLLAGAGCADEDISRGVLSIVDIRKIDKSAQRLIKKIAGGASSKKNKSENSIERSLFLHAYGTRGEVTLDTFKQTAKSVYIIADPYGAAYIFLAALRRHAKAIGIPIVRIPSPLTPERDEAIYIENHSCDVYIFTDKRRAAVISSEEGSINGRKTNGDVSIINMDRFIDRDDLRHHRGKLRFSAKCRSILIEGALEELSEAGHRHGALEEIYKSSVDFEKWRDFSEVMVDKIINE